MSFLSVRGTGQRERPIPLSFESGPVSSYTLTLLYFLVVCKTGQSQERTRMVQQQLYYIPITYQILIQQNLCLLCITDRNRIMEQQRKAKKRQLLTTHLYEKGPRTRTTKAASSTRRPLAAESFTRRKQSGNGRLRSSCGEHSTWSHQRTLLFSLGLYQEVAGRASA